MNNFHWIKWVACRTMSGKSSEIPSNVTLLSGKEKLEGNDIVLKSNSKYLKCLLEESEQVPVQLQLQSSGFVNTEDLKVLLNYISSGYLPDELITGSLLISAYSLEMPDAIKRCLNYLGKNINAANAFDIMIGAYRAKQQELATMTWNYVVENKENINLPAGVSSFKDFFAMARKPMVFASKDFMAYCKLQSFMTSSELSDDSS